MAEPLIHSLEAIQINNEDMHTPRAAMVAPTVQCGFQPVNEQRSIGQARHPVIHGIIQNALFGNPQIGDVR